MASLHGARAHRLLDRGAIAPGYVADLALLDDLESFSASLVLKDGRVPEYPAETPAELRDTMRSRAGLVRHPRRARAGAGDRDPAGPADHRPRRGHAARPRRSGGRRSGARSGEDRRDRAPPRDRARRARARARLRPRARRVRLDRRPRRAQPRRGRRRRRRHGAVRGARPGAGRRARRGPRRRGPRRARAADRRAALGRPAGAGRRRPRGPAGSARGAGRDDRRAVHDALVPRALGDPVAEDHRPRARRRRRLRSSSRSRSNGQIALDRDAFVARFGALYEHSPWVAENAWQPTLRGHRGARRRAARRDVRRAAGGQARADPRASRPRREGRRLDRALPQRAGRPRPRPPLPRRARALHDHERRLPREVRHPVRDLRARARQGLDPRERRRALGQHASSRRSRPRSGEIAKIARLRLEDAL